MKTKFIKREVREVIFTCEYCGKESIYSQDIVACEKKCLIKKNRQNCEHNFILSIELDIDYDNYTDLNIYNRCSKCNYLEGIITIEDFKIEDYLTVDVIKKLYEDNK